ncbi:MAG TPA: Ig-like domain-containing protein [Steroidobacteraceae bacterium]|nr:Ig-like domain-containing protein [Steroidobacteraceae bacterium]
MPVPSTSTTPTLTSIEVTPSLATAAAGTTTPFRATGLYSDNSKQDLTTQVTWASSDTAVATVSNNVGFNGVATTVGAGSTAVSAASGAVRGETTLTVTDATLVSIEVSPATPNLANGLTQAFTATGRYSDNSTQDITTQVAWASSNAAVATVSNAAGSHGLATTAGVGNTTISATAGEVSGETALTVTAATLLSIEVSPAAPSIAKGLTLEFTATGRYSDNSTQDLTTQSSWVSSNPEVVTVSDAGLATTAGVGSTTVLATVGEVSGQTVLTVTDATLVSIEVSPAAPSIAHGATQSFTATGRYTDNSTQDLTTEVTWGSSDAAVATVSNAGGSNGLATTAGVGSTTVSAVSGAVSGETTLTVTDATLVSIEVSPAAPSIAQGLTQQFTATGRYSDNSTQDLTTQVTWSSSDTAVATVSNAAVSEGLATTAGVGSATVSAVSDGVSGETTLTVTDATLVSIEVSPAAPSIAHGLTQSFTATGRYTDNSTQDLTTQVTWVSSDATVATVSNAADSEGLATTTGVGSTTVSAAHGAVSGETTLTVTDATLVSIEVSPAAPSIAHGLTLQFTATGHYTDNSTHDITTQVTWASSNPAVATASNAAGSNGLATTAGTGSTTVSAANGAVSGETTLTVTDAALVSIEVSPATPSIAHGLTQQFTATGLYSDNSAQDLTAQVTWTSSDAAVATVSNAAGSEGLATTTGAGSTTVSAVSGAVSGETTLTVTDPALVSIEVSPATPSIANGSTQQFTATGRYSDDSTQDLTTGITWTSSDSAVATVSNSGFATTVGAGSTTISATSGAVTGVATLTVMSTPTVAQQLAALLAAVTGVGTGTSLADQLASVQAYLAVPDIASACSAMDVFKSHVVAQSGKKIDPALAAQITADANDIMAAIPCP